MEIKLKGKPVVFGYAKGFTFLYKKSILSIPCYDIQQVNQIDQEWQRFLDALNETKIQLEQLKENTIKTFGIHEAEIFDIQLALLDDPYILDRLREKLSETKKNVEFCLNAVVNDCSNRFKFHKLSFIQERYSDFDDVISRLLKILLKKFSDNSIEKDLEGRILLAQSLTPSDVFSLKDKGVRGILLEEKCLISHTIILAKNLGIPVIVGVENLSSLARDNMSIEINGETGEIWLDSEKSHLKANIPLKNGNFFNNLNVEFYLSYNESITEDFLSKPSIAGIGLLRSEVLFLAKNGILDEEEQFSHYKEAITKAKGKTVILRTLDIGGDKVLSTAPGKISPLGLRGIRWSLKNIPAFKAQLRAMLRASAFGNAKILYPMVSSVQELTQADEILESCKEELRSKRIPFQESIEVGVMLETSCAFLIMDLLAKYCSFFSIGTNDLMQYLLAIDRTDNQVAELYDWQHPAVLRILQMAIKQANELNKPIYMCGELPNIAEAFLFCVGLGFRKFTISADRLTNYQKLITEIDISKLQTLLCDKVNSLVKDSV